MAHYRWHGTNRRYAFFVILALAATAFQVSYSASIENDCNTLESCIWYSSKLRKSIRSQLEKLREKDAQHEEEARLLQLIQEADSREKYTTKMQQSLNNAKKFIKNKTYATNPETHLASVKTWLEEIAQNIAEFNEAPKRYFPIIHETTRDECATAYDYLKDMDEQYIPEGLAACKTIFEKIQKNLIFHSGLGKEGREIFESLQKRARRKHSEGQEQAVKCIQSLPFGNYCSQSCDLKVVKKTLDEEHYGLDTVKEIILDHLAAYSLKKNALPPVLCLVGPPGVGKTSIAKSIAKALGRSHTRIALGSLQDASELIGNSSVYVSADAGMLIKAIKSAGTMDPIIVLDEIDKIGNARHSPLGTLLEILNPEQSKTFRDSFIEIPVDLSRVFFITTANDESAIPAALRDRMLIVRVPSYTDREKLKIAQGHLVKEAIKHTGLENYGVDFDESVLSKIITEYTDEAGVRDLSRTLKTLCSKIARSVVTDGTVPNITANNLSTYLGTPKITSTDQEEEHDPVIGRVNGLAVTSIGGTVLPIQTISRPGNGKFEITGRIGETMNESVRVALSFLQANWQTLGINEHALEKMDVHVHASDAATPKDGPSAGITIATSLLSTFTGQPIDPHHAMTGEIDLLGRVLPVGGIREKILAAKRRGIKNVIIPAGNFSDIQGHPELQEGITIIPVKNIKEVFARVLLSKLDQKNATMGTKIYGH